MLFRQQKMRLHLYAGTHHVGCCEIEPTQMIQYAACAGAVFLRKLLNDKVYPQEDEVLQATEPGTTTNNFYPSHGSQDVLEATSEQQQNNPQDDTFDVGVTSDHVTPEVSLSTSEHSTTRVLHKKERGIKNMIIELDEEEVAQDPKLEDDVRTRYPWATIQSKPGPNTSRKRVARHSIDDPFVSQKLDVIEHLGDLYDYAKVPPTGFGSEEHAQAGWNTLPYARKLETAHARAIQGAYGKIMEGHSCSHCVDNNYQCKVYVPQLRNLTHMNFGPSCQHCRLEGVSCSFATTSESRISRTPTAPSSVGLKIDTVGLPRNHSCDVSVTPSTAVTPKPSLASRMTPINPSVSVQSWAGTDRDQDNTGGLVPKDAKLGDDFTTRTMSPTSPILIFAESIGLYFAPHVGSVIHSMYTHLRQHREVKPFAQRSLNLEHYYSNLVTIYTLALKQGELDLAYIVVLRFQNTSYSYPGKLPSPKVATEAFKHLPTNTPLCRWFAILYSFRWGTVDNGDYWEFTKTWPGLDPTALSKLLYAVAYIRDHYTKGDNDAVLVRWCDVHDHDDDTWQERQCQEMHSALKISPEGAKDVVKDSPYHKGKRRADSSPVRSYKKTKRGGGSFGSGR